MSFFALAILLFLLFVWFRNSNNSRMKINFLNNIPIPIIFIDTQPIFANEISNRTKQGKQINNKSLSQTKTEIFSSAKNQVIYEKKLKVLSKRLNTELENNAKEIYKDYLTQNKTGFEEIWKNFAFKQAFKYWFYEQKEYNLKAYELAQEILNQLNQDVSFEDLAKQHSQDSFSNFLGGHLGKINSESLLYELRNKLLHYEGNTNQNILIASRLGLHIVQVYKKEISNTGETMLYLKQIYLAGENFENWVQNATKDIRIIEIIKI